jgi:hypothetical protein
VTAPLPAVAEEYVSWLTVERGRAPSTIAAYRRDLAGFSDYLAARGRTLEMATAAEVESYLASMQRSHLASATVARLASVLHGLYGFLLDEGIIDVDPTSLVAPRHAATRLPVVLSESQVAELLASPSTDAAIDVARGYGSPSSSASTSVTSTSTRSSSGSPARAPSSDSSRLAAVRATRSSRGSTAVRVRRSSSRRAR